MTAGRPNRAARRHDPELREALGKGGPQQPHGNVERLRAALPAGWQRWTTVARKARLSNAGAQAAFATLEREGAAEASPDGTAWRRAQVPRPE